MSFVFKLEEENKRLRKLIKQKSSRVKYLENELAHLHARLIEAQTDRLEKIYERSNKY